MPAPPVGLPLRNVAVALALRSLPATLPITVVADEVTAEALVAAGWRAERAESVPAAAKTILLLQPSRLGRLMPTLEAIRSALAVGAPAIVAELVWQTAPSPALLRAFAPAPGGEKVRPIEGFEMHVEHAGFALAERVDVPRDAWASLPASDARRAAVEGDERKAARACAWLLRASE